MKYLLIALSVIALSGCAATGDISQKRAALKETAPKCYGEKECELMWSAARRWVLNNASMKLQIATADYMETYNPPANSPKLAVRVTKDPLPDGKGYRLDVQAWCDNIFGCLPDHWDAALAFNREVSAAR